MLKRLFAYILTLMIIAGYGMISGAAHVTAYKLKQYTAIERSTQQ